MRKVSRLLAAVSLTAACSITAEAGLIGTTLEANYFYPDLSTPYDRAAFAPQSFVVAAGIETVGTVEGVTSLITDFSDDQLIVTLNTVLTEPTWNTTPFNGVIFTLQSPGRFDMASALIDPATTLPGFDISRLSFTDSSIKLDWNGITYSDGQKVVVNFSFNAAPVPEPSTYAMLAAGLVLVGFVLRRRLAH